MKIYLYKEDKKFFTDEHIDVSKVTVTKDNNNRYRAIFRESFLKSYKTPLIMNTTTSRDFIMEKLATELATVMKNKR